MSGVIEDYPERVVVVLRRRLLESWAMVRTALQARVENVEVRRVGNLSRVNLMRRSWRSFLWAALSRGLAGRRPAVWRSRAPRAAGSGS